MDDPSVQRRHALLLARARDGRYTGGAWLGGACSIADNAPAAPTARWLENTSLRFHGGSLNGTQVTDSGVTLLPTPSLLFGARSVGYRGNPDHDFYSTIRINKQVITGLWWEHGNSFMAVRLNEFTGAFVFKPFNMSADASLSDSMAAFIDSTRAGNYLAFSVIYDGYTNVSEKLRSALRALGSSRIDFVRPGHAWILIARKGAGGQGTIEQWSPNGVADDSIIRSQHVCHRLRRICYFQPALSSGIQNILLEHAAIPRKQLPQGVYRWKPPSGNAIRWPRSPVLPPVST